VTELAKRRMFEEELEANESGKKKHKHHKKGMNARLEKYKKEIYHMKMPPVEAICHVHEVLPISVMNQLDREHIRWVALEYKKSCNPTL
jgi:hypothetical protein